MRWQFHFIRSIKNDRQKKNIPNLITLIRMMILTPLVLLFLIEKMSLAAGVIFILAGLTDLLDGYLARGWKQVSITGKILDPIADKILVLVPLLVLAINYGLPWLIVVIIFIREFIVSYSRELLEDKENLRGCISVSWLGKIKVWAQCLGIAYTIFQFPYFVEVMWVAVFFTVGSAVDYGMKYSKVRKTINNGGKKAAGN